MLDISLEVTKDDSMNLSSLSEDTEESFTTRGTLSSHKGTSSPSSSLSSHSTICIQNETIEFYQGVKKTGETDILLDELLLSPSTTMATTATNSISGPTSTLNSSSILQLYSSTFEEDADNTDTDVDATWRWTYDDETDNEFIETWKTTHSPIK